MDVKILRREILHGSLARRLILKTFLFGSAMVFMSVTKVVNEISTSEPLLLNLDECLTTIGSNPNPDVKLPGFIRPASSSLFMPCDEPENQTITVIKELLKNDMLYSAARALCVGEGSDSLVAALQDLGFSNTFGVQRHPFFSLLQKQFVYELDFKDYYFDFVFSRALDKVSVPALLLQEIERVLRPGGTGAMLVGSPKFDSGSLVRSATPISLFLKRSDIIHVCRVSSLNLVIFKKKFDNVGLFEYYRLPDKCPSISNNKPLMKYIEPVAHLEAQPVYLPTFLNVSLRSSMSYINLGGGELETMKFKYPVRPEAFSVYVVHHNPSAITSFVKKPGFTFVYHPGLLGNEAEAPYLASDEVLSAPPDEEDFEFVRWFKETIKEGQFVVLMMNAGVAELRILFDFFITGAICHVDELFIRCDDKLDCEGNLCGNCLSLFQGLRNGGVYVHQWWGD